MLIRLFLASIAALLLAALPSACSARPPYSGDVVFRMETGRGHCSATAIGPHVILTASHCVGDVRAIQLNGAPAVEVLSLTHDGRDHVLIRVAFTFKHWAKLGPAPKQGQAIYIRGNPGFLKDQLRFGTMSGVGKLPAYVAAEQGEPLFLLEFWFFDIPSTGGDSGSAIFDSRGRVCAVVSIGTDPLTDPFHLMGALPFKFSADQWTEARR